MKTKLIEKLSAALLILILIFSLSSCDIILILFDSNSKTPIEDPKEEISAAIDTVLEGEPKNHIYVWEYLVDFGITGFYTHKFQSYERAFGTYYNYGDGLPEITVHAKNCANHFLDNYYDNIDLSDPTDVTDALLYSYVDTVGDIYAYYRTAEEFSDFEQDMSGKFGGIGVQVEYNHTEKTIMVNQVFKDKPADAAGMKVGDYIVGVDGMSLEQMGGYLKVVDFMRGEIGTNVTVTVDRNGERLDLVITRAEIVETIVEYHLTDDGYGYIKINSFKDTTAEQFIFAVEALEELGAVGYIFDVRSNPGGYVYSVVDVISYIVPTDEVVISYDYKFKDTEYDRTHDEALPEDEGGNVGDHVIDVPYVVICDEYTASAGEIFVACLRDYEEMGIMGDTTIVGTTTFGKGIMQASVGYTDGSYATMTVAYYNPPSGVNYHGIGIIPDVEVEMSPDRDTQYYEAIVQLELLLESK